MEEGQHYLPASIFNSVDRWLTHRPGSEVEVPDDLKNAIRDRLLGILFSQSFDIIDRGIGTPGDLNFGCQVALGFRKGPLDVMRDLVVQKFSDPLLQSLLETTGDEELIEGNHWGDVFWGVCKGVGENHLGKILMKVRGRWVK